jgi:hypothetical protein
MARTGGRAALAIALALIGGAARAQSGDLTLGVGAAYTTGKYGAAQRTDMFFVPFTAKYEKGPWILRAMLPYVRISGPANVVAAGEETIALPDGNAARRTDSGFGDFVASAFYNALPGTAGGLGLDLGAKVKVATADDTKGLGTGKNDYAVQADAFKTYGAVTAFGTIGYRWYGDPPGLDLRDVPYFSLGAALRRSSATTLGALYDRRPAISRGGSQLSEATLYLSQRLAGDWKLQLYGLKGFTDASPEWGAGATLTYTY